jgi:hypothetical protein
MAYEEERAGKEKGARENDFDDRVRRQAGCALPHGLDVAARGTGAGSDRAEAAERDRLLGNTGEGREHIEGEAAKEDGTEAEGERGEELRQWVFRLPSCPIESRRYLPQIRAVYFLLGGDEILYVGGTERLRGRWTSHAKVWNRDDKKSLRIAFAPMQVWMETGDVYEVEEIFIRLLRPPLNNKTAIREISPSMEYRFLELTSIDVRGSVPRPPKGSKKPTKKGKK